MPKIREKTHSVEEELALLRLFRAALPYFFHLQTKQLTDVIGWIQRNLVFGNSVFIDDVYYKDTYTSLRRALTSDEPRLLLSKDGVEGSEDQEDPPVPTIPFEEINVEQILHWEPEDNATKVSEVRKEDVPEQTTQQEPRLLLSKDGVERSEDKADLLETASEQAPQMNNTVTMAADLVEKQKADLEKDTKATPVAGTFVGDVIRAQRRTIDYLSQENRLLREQLEYLVNTNNDLRTICYDMLVRSVQLSKVNGKIVVRSTATFPVVARMELEDKTFIKNVLLQQNTSVVLADASNGNHFIVTLSLNEHNDQSGESVMSSGPHVVYMI